MTVYQLIEYESSHTSDHEVISVHATLEGAQAITPPEWYARADRPPVWQERRDAGGHTYWEDGLARSIWPYEVLP